MFIHTEIGSFSIVEWSSVIRSHLSFPDMGEGDTFTNGNLCLAFRHKAGGQRANRFQLQVASFGMAYSDPFQYQGWNGARGWGKMRSEM